MNIFRRLERLVVMMAMFFAPESNPWQDGVRCCAQSTQKAGSGDPDRLRPAGDGTGGVRRYEGRSGRVNGCTERPLYPHLNPRTVRI